jgi:hypothetical protein
MAKRPWSVSDHEILRSLALRGLSEAEIAAQMQRSKSSVRTNAATINVKIARDWNGTQKFNKLVRRRGGIGLRPSSD